MIFVVTLFCGSTLLVNGNTVIVEDVMCIDRGFVTSFQFEYYIERQKVITNKSLDCKDDVIPIMLLSIRFLYYTQLTKEKLPMCLLS